MKRVARYGGLVAALLILAALGVFLAIRSGAKAGARNRFERKTRVHLDHAAFFQKPFQKGEEVTRACLQCHPQAAAEVMKTSHWTWLGDEVNRPGMKAPQPVGKANLINNYCIGIQGNWASCTKCHAGYGWDGPDFDFKDSSKVDCLVCHDGSGAYSKGVAGQPAPGSDLLAAARSVGYSKRSNCGTCHFYGGGGLGVKHGDLDNSLDNPTADLDVHMGKHQFLCADCHQTEHHQIPGKSFAVSVKHAGGIGCADCHQGLTHRDARVESHLNAVACQTCHIPSFARKVPTKMDWDWSKAGDPSRKEDPHSYLKVKGEFKYEQDVRPDYGWFKLEVDRYLAGDPINERGPTELNAPKGSIRDAEAKIWPFKVNRGKQPMDAVTRRLLVPTTGGKGGYWSTFDWKRSMELGGKAMGLSFSGKVGFAETRMVWPLSHMVAPKEKALGCADCHSPGGRMDFKALGYAGDPIKLGGRKP